MLLTWLAIIVSEIGWHLSLLAIAVTLLAETFVACLLSDKSSFSKETLGRIYNHIPPEDTAGTGC
jgi:hypothetical protein